MSGALGALASLGPIAKAVEAVANAFGLQVQRKATAEERDAGATAAEDETALDTAEIADEQARINTEHPAALDIARELRADADEAERGGKV